MSRRIRNVLIAVAALVVIVVVGAIFFIVPNMNDDDNASPVPAPPTTQPEPTDASGSGSNGQRGFGTPVVDILGRKVTVPNNPIGQPLPQSPPEPRVECTPTNTPVTSPSGVQIQQTASLPLLVSTSDGPAEMSGNVPTGYTQTPQGAALAGWNWVATTYGPGPVAKDAYELLTVHTEELDRGASTEAWDSPGQDAATGFPAPVAFRIGSCTSDFASVEFAIEVPIDDNGQRRTTPVYTVLRTSMFYDGGTWRSRLDKRSVATDTGITDISSFTPWSFA